MSGKITLKITATPIWALPKGHRERRGGAGIHGDRRTRRLRTRGERLRFEIRSQLADRSLVY